MGGAVALVDGQRVALLAVKDRHWRVGDVALWLSGIGSSRSTRLRPSAGPSLWGTGANSIARVVKSQSSWQSEQTWTAQLSLLMRKPFATFFIVCTYYVSADTGRHMEFSIFIRNSRYR